MGAIQHNFSSIPKTMEEIQIHFFQPFRYFLYFSLYLWAEVDDLP